MVTLLGCIRRRDDLTREEFLRYWREVHGPVVTQVPEFMRHIKKYVQNHPISLFLPGFPTVSPQFDGVAQMWADSSDELAQAYREPRFWQVIYPDGSRFVNFVKGNVMVMNQIVFHGGSVGFADTSLVKLMAFFKRKEGMTHEEFRHVWQDEHAPLVLGIPQFMRHIRRYVQNHPLDVSVSVSGSEGKEELSFDGVAELWADNIEELSAAFSEPEFQKVIYPHGQTVVDPHACPQIVVRETVIHDS
jgi:uncharacterized protein (TIGR02118 family)